MSTSNTQLRYIKETAYGVAPDPVGSLIVIRNTGDTMKANPSSDTSKEIRSDRMTTDSIMLDVDAGGDINCDLSSGNSDDFKESAMASTWGTPLVTSANDISAESADDSFNSVAGDFLAVAGQWIKIAGFADVTGVLNGYHKVVTATTNKLVVDTTLADEAAANLISVEGSMIRNGTTMDSYLIEREHTRITQFLSWAGCVVGGYKLNLAHGSVITEVFSFIGKNEAIAQVTLGTDAATPAPTESRMAATVNVANIREAGLPVSGVYFQSLDMALDNTATAKKAIGNLGSVDADLRTIKLTGSVVPYFENADLYDKLMAFTSTSLSWRCEKDNKAYIYTIPRVRFTGGDVPCGSIDQDEILNLSWTAELETIGGASFMLQIDKFE